MILLHLLHVNIELDIIYKNRKGIKLIKLYINVIYNCTSLYFIKSIFFIKLL